MLGKYHIIHANAQPIQRRVRCYETGRYHRHNTHVEEFFRSAPAERRLRSAKTMPAT